MINVVLTDASSLQMVPDKLDPFGRPSQAERAGQPAVPTRAAISAGQNRS